MIHTGEHMHNQMPNTYALAQQSLHDAKAHLCAAIRQVEQNQKRPNLKALLLNRILKVQSHINAALEEMV